MKGSRNTLYPAIKHQGLEFSPSEKIKVGEVRRSKCARLKASTRDKKAPVCAELGDHGAKCVNRRLGDSPAPVLALADVKRVWCGTGVSNHNIHTRTSTWKRDGLLNVSPTTGLFEDLSYVRLQLFPRPGLCVEDSSGRRHSSSPSKVAHQRPAEPVRCMRLILMQTP